LEKNESRLGHNREVEEAYKLAVWTCHDSSELDTKGFRQPCRWLQKSKSRTSKLT